MSSRLVGLCVCVFVGSLLFVFLWLPYLCFLEIPQIRSQCMGDRHPFFRGSLKRLLRLCRYRYLRLLPRAALLSLVSPSSQGKDGMRGAFRRGARMEKEILLM